MSTFTYYLEQAAKAADFGFSTKEDINYCLGCEAKDINDCLGTVYVNAFVAFSAARRAQVAFNVASCDSQMRVCLGAIDDSKYWASKGDKLAAEECLRRAVDSAKRGASLAIESLEIKSNGGYREE